jgi:D-aspartate ligase
MQKVGQKPLSSTQTTNEGAPSSVPDEPMEFAAPPAVVVGVTWANGLGLIRSLGEAGVPVLALNPTPNPVGFASRYVTRALLCPDPADAEADFLSFMDRLGQRLNHRGVLFLTRDEDVSTVSRNQARLERHFAVPFAGWDVLSRIVDKEGQYATAAQVGVPLPVTFFPRDEPEAIDCAGRMTYPAIVKPAYHARFFEQFGVKGFFAHDAKEAVGQVVRGAAAGYRMLIQEVVPGKADRLYTLGSYLNRAGEPLAMFTGRKLRQNPRDFGSCRIGESCPAPEVAELGLRLLRALGFWGISQVEFKLDPRDGQFKLMEVNARSYQWQHLSTACGANLAHTAYCDALGQSPAPLVASTDGRRWVLTLTDLVMSPAEIARGQTSPREWLSGWHRVAADGFFSVRDPRPGWRYLQRLFRKQMAGAP